MTIVGEDGHPLAAGERGEIWVRGPTVMPGYLDAPELNQATFREGWFRTGDIGSLDGDGFLSLHGRLSEIINRGREKIAPAEIESALLRHPAIAEAAAFAIAHPRLGDDVAAAVIPHPGAQMTAAELRQFHGLRGEPIPPSIQEMAADRLPLILERQTSGPFLLGGKCNGAMVAFETARLLMAAGHKVDMVAMVDPPTVSARPVQRAIIGLMKPIVSPDLLRWTMN